MIRGNLSIVSLRSKSPSINVQMEMQMIVVAIPPSSDTM